MFLKRKQSNAISLIALLTGTLIAGCGQTVNSPKPSDSTEKTSSEQIYLYQGSDRDQKLVENAKKEGTVTLYTSMNLDDSQPLTDAFEKKYGIKIVLWRAGSEKVVQRAITEAKAKRFDVDVIETNGPEMEMLAREQLAHEFYSPYFSDLPPEAIPAHKKWVADRFNFFVMAYNTNKVSPAEAPKTYQDFLDPKWKGKIALESSDTEWFATLAKIWGEEKGLQYFKALADMNPIIREGHTLMGELVASGEIPITLTVYNHYAEQLKKKGAPIEWVPLEPTIGRPNGISVMKNAPHPHAALLFADFVLSPEGQEIINNRGRVPSSTKVKTNLNNFKYKMADPVVVLDEWDKWNKMWEDLFLKSKK
ncbi:ABC transporter substrate-binding protein [Effusibacillus lacus]|uniref:ABC transporter substrate-binding protein n=1 Tax=Effusibacillus lacus TaxID=1348429 RepID=UPI000BB6AB03|nr:extracellular solute-binding protein [Effusibacillus lacus]